MKQPQNNLSPESSKAKKELEAINQQIQHKNAAAQAAQKKLDDLNDQYDKQTAVLLKEQAAVLAEARLVVEAELAEKKPQLDALKAEITELKQQHTSLDDELKPKEERLAAMNRNIMLARQNFITIEQDFLNLNEDISALVAKKTELETANSSLTDIKTELQAEISTLETTKDAKQTALEDLIARYEAIDEEKQESLLLVNSKLLKDTQKLQEVQEKETTIRSELSVWQRQLEERDRNLRVREIKVSTGEDKLIQNSNLLNL